MFAKINHIAIASDQYAINPRFYEALFGLKSAKNYRPARAAVVSDGYVGMNIIPRRDGRTSGLDHFGLQVEDIEEARARIEKCDPTLSILKRPPVRPYAAYSGHDPDTNIFDLSQQNLEMREDVYAEPVGDGRWTVVGVTTNITERKEAEEEVRRSEEHFRRIFEDGPLGMTIVGADLEMSDVNETLCRMLGYTREEMLGLSIEAVTHPDDWATDLDQGAQVMRGEIPTYSIEKRYIKKNGDILWGRLTGAAVHDADGAPLYGVGMVEDITERKQDELLRAALYDIAEAVHTTADVQAMYRAIYASLAELVDAPRFAILLSLPDEPVN